MARELPYCQTHVTGSHVEAWVVLLELAALVRSLEHDEGATVILMSIVMDEEAEYRGHVTVEVTT